MDLADLLGVVRDRWRIVLAAVLGTLLAAGAAATLPTPVYRSTSELFVSTRGGASAADLVQGSTFSQQRVQSYASIVTSPLVLEPVAEELDHPGGAGALAEAVQATTSPDTVLIEITASSSSPEQAAEIANATAASFVAVVQDLEAPDGSGESPVRITVVEPGAVPALPASPNVPRTLALGAVLGLLLGVGLAVLRAATDTAVRGDRDVEAVTDAGIVARFPAYPDARRRPLVVHTDPDSPWAEEFRKLRTNLHFVDASYGLRSLTVTSAVPTEGKSLVAANLAITVATAGTRVCLVDGDLRRPTVGSLLGLDGSVGLTTVLTGRAPLEDVVQPWGDGALDVLLTGPLPPNPSELLGSTAMQAVLRRLEQDYDLVVIDSPPLLPVTDAALLATQSTGALVVARAGTLQRPQLERAMEALTAARARCLGVVLNGMPGRYTEAGGYSYARVPGFHRDPAQDGDAVVPAPIPLPLADERPRHRGGGLA